MTRILHFVKKPEIRKYDIQNIKFELKMDKHVFPPSPHGSFFASNIKIKRGQTVIDVGTGSGFLAILAAKMGGKVSGTDNDIDAVKLAKINAAQNKVAVDFKHGPYFANFKKKFDIILVNLPQVIVHKNYRKAIGKQLTNTLHGGPNGNAQVLEFLDMAKNFMHKKTKLYMIVYTVTNFKETIQKIVSDYDAKLIAFESGPTKEYVDDNIEFYKKLNHTGKISIFKKNGKWWGYEYMFELGKK